MSSSWCVVKLKRLQAGAAAGAQGVQPRLPAVTSQRQPPQARQQEGGAVKIKSIFEAQICERGQATQGVHEGLRYHTCVTRVTGQVQRSENSARPRGRGRQRRREGRRRCDKCPGAGLQRVGGHERCDNVQAQLAQQCAVPQGVGVGWPGYNVCGCRP